MLNTVSETALINVNIFNHLSSFQRKVQTLLLGIKSELRFCGKFLITRFICSLSRDAQTSFLLMNSVSFFQFADWRMVNDGNFSLWSSLYGCDAFSWAPPVAEISGEISGGTKRKSHIRRSEIHEIHTERMERNCA